VLGRVLINAQIAALLFAVPATVGLSKKFRLVQKTAIDGVAL
jgi:hypothetical protein